MQKAVAMFTASAEQKNEYAAYQLGKLYLQGEDVPKDMKILVSSCLLGCNCKYNGSNNLNLHVINHVRDRDVIIICPEMLAGIGTPRACAEIVNGKIVDEHGVNVDELYRTGVMLALKAIAGEELELAILQSRSPTCGVNEIYDGSFTGKIIKGRGIFAQALMDAGYNVMDADDFYNLNMQ